MKRNKKQKIEEDAGATVSQLERDLSSLVEGAGISQIRSLMQQMSILEQRPRFYVTSRPACNSEL